MTVGLLATNDCRITYKYCSTFVGQFNKQPLKANMDSARSVAFRNLIFLIITCISIKALVKPK